MNLDGAHPYSDVDEEKEDESHEEVEITTDFATRLKEMQRIGKGKYLIRKARTNTKRDKSGDLAA